MKKCDAVWAANELSDKVKEYLRISFEQADKEQSFYEKYTTFQKNFQDKFFGKHRLALENAEAAFLEYKLGMMQQILVLQYSLL